MSTRAITYNILFTCVANFMLPTSIHFEISIPQDEYNFRTLGAPLTPWGGGLHNVIIIYFLVDYRYTYLDINCK